MREHRLTVLLSLPRAEATFSTSVGIVEVQESAIKELNVCTTVF